MPHELTIAILAGAGGMLGWGLADFFAKKAITAIGDMASLLLAHVFGTIAFGLLVIIEIGRGHSIQAPTFGTLGLIAFFGVLQAAVYIFLYKGFAQGPVSLLGAIFASFPGITVLLSVLIFKEALTGVFGIVVIFVGILLLSTDHSALKKFTLRLNKIPGLFEIAIATVLAALWTLLWDQLVGGKDWALFAFLMYAFMTLAIWAVATFQKVSLRGVPKPIWLLLVLIGVCETIAYAAISYGYSATTTTSVIAMVSGAFALPTIVLAWIFLHERMSGLQIMGAVAVVLGIVLIPFT